MTEKVEKNWLEWIVFSVSFVLVIGLVAYLVWNEITADASPPSIVVELGDMRQQGDSYLIPVKVINKGGQAAKAVAVEVVLVQAGQDLETAQLDVDFVPRSSNRSGWVTFTENPAEADEIQTHVLGYEVP